MYRASLSAVAASYRQLEMHFWMGVSITASKTSDPAKRLSRRHGAIGLHAEDRVDERAGVLSELIDLPSSRPD